MKITDYPEPSPACEKLRQHLRAIYSPIIRPEPENETTDLTAESIEMTENLHSARAAARVLGVPLSRILKAIHAKVIVPHSTSSKQLLITVAQLEILRLHLTK